ncbi:MAG: WYL domain-containing protein, partial [Deltaproteobacteria bacterium]
LPGPRHDYRARDADIATLRRAIADRRTLALRYRSRGRPTRPRSLDPDALVWPLGARYVVGYCHQRRELRTFLVDRIRAVAITPRTFVPPPTFRLDELFRGAFGIFRGRPERIHLRFAPAVADLATERLWHDSQRLTQKLDGSVELRLHVAPTPDLVSTILAFGRHVRVLAPKSLAQTVAKEWFAAAGESAKALREKGKPARPVLSRVPATLPKSARQRGRGRRRMSGGSEARGR